MICAPAPPARTAGAPLSRPPHRRRPTGGHRPEREGMTAARSGDPQRAGARANTRSFGSGCDAFARVTPGVPGGTVPPPPLPGLSPAGQPRSGVGWPPGPGATTPQLSGPWAARPSGCCRRAGPVPHRRRRRSRALGRATRRCRRGCRRAAVGRPVDAGEYRRGVARHQGGHGWGCSSLTGSSLRADVRRTAL